MPLIAGRPRVLVVDNYDSFTYNLVQYVRQAGADCTVRHNDEASVEELWALQPAGVLISPGPGQPSDAGVSLDLIRRAPARTPILGVCLGHQALGLSFGARIVRAERPVHGQTSRVSHDGRGVFTELPSPFEAMRYHSLLVASDGLPSELEVSARSEQGEIMGLRHRRLPLEGVQFHPESILTEHGLKLVQNWLSRL
jgi:anthranilate synthase/aminodeoxychorismate synthase-like glutamine amidotransferase